MSIPFDVRKMSFARSKETALGGELNPAGSHFRMFTLPPETKQQIHARVIVAGSRKWVNHEIVEAYLKVYLEQFAEVTIITGMAMGPDRFAYEYALKNDVPYEEYPADWDTHGKSAGYIRNSSMGLVGTHLIAFWDGVSKGTKNMIDIATKRGMDVTVILRDLTNEERPKSRYKKASRFNRQTNTGVAEHGTLQNAA